MADQDHKVLVELDREAAGAAVAACQRDAAAAIPNSPEEKQWLRAQAAIEAALASNQPQVKERVAYRVKVTCDGKEAPGVSGYSELEFAQEEADRLNRLFPGNKAWVQKCHVTEFRTDWKDLEAQQEPEYRVLYDHLGSMGQEELSHSEALALYKQLAKENRKPYLQVKTKLGWRSVGADLDKSEVAG